MADGTKEDYEPLIGTEGEKLMELEAKPIRKPYFEHKLTFAELNKRFNSRINLESPMASLGLMSENVQYLLDKYGPNFINPPPTTPLWLLFLMQFANLFMLLLLAAACLCLVIYWFDPSNSSELTLGVFLVIVVVVTCYETYLQEAKADELMETFRCLVPEDATVIRDGVQKAIGVANLVVGDVVTISAGQKIPADCRVIFVQSFKVDQSSITGESEAVESCVHAEDDKPLEAKNIIFNGSLAVEGTCFAVVIRTGDETLIGGMVGLTSDVNKESTNLKKDIEYFVLIITVFSLIQAFIVMVIGIAKGMPFLNVFIQGFVVIIVANIPQGLPSTVVTCLHIIAERMIAQNVFVKKLDVIETLGACSLICTDKTGTLTENKMTVANLWTYNQSRSAKQFLDLGLEEMILPSDMSVTRMLMDCAILNSRVVNEQQKSSGEMQLKGDATEMGLYRYMSGIVRRKVAIDAEVYRTRNAKIHEIPFNSTNKWQLTIHSMIHANGKECMYLKGAPDVILSKCSKYANSAGMAQPIDAAFAKAYKETYESFGGKGERVLAFSMCDLDTTIEVEERKDPKYRAKLNQSLTSKGADGKNDFIFIGLITLLDPPREEVPGAIRACHKAGIKVVMVTGDHPITAAAIAKNIGLINHPTKEDVAATRGIAVNEVDDDEVHAVVVHGYDIPDMNDDDWQLVLSKEEIVFARTSPEQKLIIVKKFTAAGYLTAMTGDGVNDSPALKQAAIGIAMGQNGSDVAREAADIILLDDNFASIVIGIKEGRLLFANLKKSIAYTLAHTTPEVAVSLACILLAWPLPTTAILLLCIDLLTELLPAMSLAYEQPENNIMDLPPRNITANRLISFPLLGYSYFQAGVIIMICCFTGYFMAFDYFGISMREVSEFDGRYFSEVPVGIYVSDLGRAYSTDRQKQIMSIIQGTYYLTIVFCQAVHIWTCRTMILSIFTHGVFSNPATNIGVLISVCLGLLVVYVPFLQMLDGAGGALILIVLQVTTYAFVALWSWSELRKYIIRNYPDNIASDLLRW